MLNRPSNPVDVDDKDRVAHGIAIEILCRRKKVDSFPPVSSFPYFSKVFFLFEHVRFKKDFRFKQDFTLSKMKE